MALRQILTEPNKILREKSVLVEKIDEDLQKLMDDMLETMYAAPGIGLAAIQIGVPKRVIVLDIAPKDGPKNPMYFINQEIIGLFLMMFIRVYSLKSLTQAKLTICHTIFSNK